jgi:hypothetical protein
MESLCSPHSWALGLTWKFSIFMKDTKHLRVEYNNNWPTKFLFPVEEQLKKRLDENNIQQVFLPVSLSHSNDKEFHTLLGHFLEGIDQLPLRPDMAFDSIWKSLDAEFFKVKDESSLPQHTSRFDVFVQKVSSDKNTSKAFIPLLQILPMQTSEFVAKRILNSKVAPDNHAEPFLKRVKACFGEPLYLAFFSKYEGDWVSSPESTQRRAGGFLKRLVAGDELNIDGRNHKLSENGSIKFLISVLMPQFRNERAHGTTFVPFRSSVAKMKTYAHAYFLLLVAYALLLEVFLYRSYGVVAQEVVTTCIEKNKDIFLLVFNKDLKK